MLRRLFGFACVLLTLALLDSARGQQVGEKQPVYIRVLLPQDDAVLKIDGTPTKQTGKSRLFVSPPLEPGISFTYTLTATWEPNNYTKVIRTRLVNVRAGSDIEADLRTADPKNPDKFVIRFVPTPDEVVEAMCKIAKVAKGDVVYDLGCGDGRIVITAVKKFGALRGVGVDLNPERVKDSNANAKKEEVTDKVTFRQGDVLNIKDLGDASVVMLYMGEDVNLRLMPILKKTLKPGSRVVSHDFGMGDWKPEQKIVVKDEDGDEHEVYLWTIKAKE